VGTQIPHAVGFAYGRRLQGDDAVTLVYFGDGATSTPDFHLGMNLAGLWQTPTLFLCRNNGYAISTPVSRQTASATLAEKAAPYGVRGERVDGNDILAVYQATREAAERARAATADRVPRCWAPTLIEAVTYRLGPHTTADDPDRYRSTEESTRWHARDPIRRFRLYLERKGIWSEQQQAAAWQDAEAEVSAAFREAATLPPPDPSSLIDDVYAHRPRHLEEQFKELCETEAAVQRSCDGSPD
jgi:TPP-dependent pyruvate/acetoin dehydrogenase alpha subunit